MRVRNFILTVKTVILNNLIHIRKEKEKIFKHIFNQNFKKLKFLEGIITSNNQQ